MGIWGYSQGLAGWAVTPGPMVVIPVAILSGRLAGRIGHRPLLLAGGVLYAVAQAWLTLRIGTTPDYLATWLPGQLLGGTAIGLVLPALSGAAVAKLGPTRFGVGGGVNNAMRQFGGAAGAALAVAVVGKAGASLLQFQHLYAVSSGLGLLTALLCLPVQTRSSKAVAEPIQAAS
jgi:MFS family permease